MLGLANYMNILTSLNFISFEQFNNDNGYLYNALQQALKSNGSDLVIQQDESQDGIVVYHNLVQKYRYGGDMETYKCNLLCILYTKYYKRYPGRALGYLDNWEAAAIKFDNIAPEEKTTTDAKSTNFGPQFTVLNNTDFLIEQVRDTTNTWNKMVDSLRTKLARRVDQEKKSAMEHARANKATGIQQVNTNAQDEGAVKYYIRAVQRFNRKEN